MNDKESIDENTITIYKRLYSPENFQSLVNSVIRFNENSNILASRIAQSIESISNYVERLTPAIENTILLASEIGAITYRFNELLIRNIDWQQVIDIKAEQINLMTKLLTERAIAVSNFVDEIAEFQESSQYATLVEAILNIGEEKIGFNEKLEVFNDVLNNMQAPDISDFNYNSQRYLDEGLVELEWTTEDSQAVNIQNRVLEKIQSAQSKNPIIYYILTFIIISIIQFHFNAVYPSFIELISDSMKSVSLSGKQDTIRYVKSEVASYEFRLVDFLELYVVKSETLLVYESRSMRSYVISKLSLGDVIKANRKYKDWIEIEICVDDEVYTGWVKSKYILRLN